jgi:hypothetical protein
MKKTTSIEIALSSGNTVTGYIVEDKLHFILELDSGSIFEQISLNLIKSLCKRISGPDGSGTLHKAYIELGKNRVEGSALAIKETITIDLSGDGDYMEIAGKDIRGIEKKVEKKKKKERISTIDFHDQNSESFHEK